MDNYDSYEELYHHGIKGQKWGVRRYQNPDGSLTDAGVKRYGKNTNKYSGAYERKHQRAYNKMRRGVKTGKITEKQMNKGLKELGMSKKEIDYRDARRNYSRLSNASFGVGWFFGGPIVGVATDVAVMSITPKGREFTERYNDTKLQYLQEQAKYRNSHGYY